MSATGELLAEDDEVCGGLKARCLEAEYGNGADVAGAATSEEESAFNIGPRQPCMQQQAEIQLLNDIAIQIVMQCTVVSCNIQRLFPNLKSTCIGNDHHQTTCKVSQQIDAA